MGEIDLKKLDVSIEYVKRMAEVERRDENKTQTLPAEKGMALGIYTQERESQYGMS